mmetsp:Transcript_423/g.1539  ORF Transcript_423/g.1539 Transcript_423/m.1539 type:complete len:201 (+) Transcript_423:1641-2243(+)
MGVALREKDARGPQQPADEVLHGRRLFKVRRLPHENVEQNVGLGRLQADRGAEEVHHWPVGRIADHRPRLRGGKLHELLRSPSRRLAGLGRHERGQVHFRDAGEPPAPVVKRSTRAKLAHAHSPNPQQRPEGLHVRGPWKLLHDHAVAVEAFPHGNRQCACDERHERADDGRNAHGRFHGVEHLGLGPCGAPVRRGRARC